MNLSILGFHANFFWICQVIFEIIVSILRHLNVSSFEISVELNQESSSSSCAEPWSENCIRLNIFLADKYGVLYDFYGNFACLLTFVNKIRWEFTKRRRYYSHCECIYYWYSHCPVIISVEIHNFVSNFRKKNVWLCYSRKYFTKLF